jgi:hypothetical protein
MWQSTSRHQMGLIVAGHGQDIEGRPDGGVVLDLDLGDEGLE